MIYPGSVIQLLSSPGKRASLVSIPNIIMVTGTVLFACVIVGTLCPLIGKDLAFLPSYDTLTVVRSSRTAIPPFLQSVFNSKSLISSWEPNVLLVSSPPASSTGSLCHSVASNNITSPQSDNESGILEPNWTRLTSTERKTFYMTLCTSGMTSMSSLKPKRPLA
jgi:hypothetical protein